MPQTSSVVVMYSVVIDYVSGEYVLAIKFNDEHITNSPYVVHVSHAQHSSQLRQLDAAGYQVETNTTSLLYFVARGGSISCRCRAGRV